MEVGKLCVKIAGRDAGKKCVIVEVIDNTYVLIDGGTRRRKCNKMHLEPLDQKLDIKKGASHSEVTKAFEKLKIQVWTKKSKQKKEKPKKVRKKKEKIELKKKSVEKKVKEEKTVPKEPKKKEEK